MTSTVWIVTWDGNICGVFALERGAERYIRNEGHADADVASGMVIERHDVQGPYGDTRDIT